MTYRVLIKLANGSTVWQQVSGTNIGQARQVAEAQYGRERVLQIINT